MGNTTWLENAYSFIEYCCRISQVFKDRCREDHIKTVRWEWHVSRITLNKLGWLEFLTAEMFHQAFVKLSVYAQGLTTSCLHDPDGAILSPHAILTT
jgi:hypothetical protein